MKICGFFAHVVLVTMGYYGYREGFYSFGLPPGLRKLYG